MPFLPMVLSGRGLDAREIAIVMAVSPLLRITTAPWLGSLADRFSHRKNAAMLYSAVAAVLMTPLLWVETFLPVLMVIALSSIFWLSVLPVVDALAIVAAKRDGLQYGRMRVWGSLAFVAANLLAGWLLDGSGPEILATMIVTTAGLTAFAALALPADGPAHDSGRSKSSPWSMPALKIVLSDPPVALTLAAAGLGQAAHAMVYAFGTIHWKHHGLSGFEIGSAWAIGVVAEILLFAGAGKIVGPRAPERLILLGLSAGLVRWSLAPFADGTATILGLQILHGITFGATHLGAMRLVADRLPNAHAGGVLGLYTGFSGLAMSASFALSGPLFQTFGGNGFWAMAIICLVALLGVVAIIPKARNRADKPSTPHI